MNGQNIFFRVISDLHLNYYSPENIPDIINEILSYRTDIFSNQVILILAGDLGNPTEKAYFQFLEIVSKLFKQVIFIPGNHEYYKNDYQKIQELLLNYPYPENVIFLNNSSYTSPDKIFRILGTTFWSNNNTKIPFLTKNNKTITYNDEKVDPQIYNRLHQNDKKWLTSQLTQSFPGVTIVLTHHCPSYKLLNPKYANSPRNSYYASNCEDLLNKCDVWICGHSHYTKHHIISNCRVYLNPLGYPEDEIDLDPGLIVI